MKEPYSSRLARLRELMRQSGIDAYLIVSDDFHASEYVGDYFKCREYVSGFSGSAGTLLVMPEEAFLWTDGRYFLQAAEQLDGTGILLMKMGEPGVPTLQEQLQQSMQKGQTLGYDGRTISCAMARRIKSCLMEKQLNYAEQQDLVGTIWDDRPAFPCSPVWMLSEEYSGRSRADKLAAVRKKMCEHRADAHLLASLDDIAWLFNLRGEDVAHNPVFMSYALITKQGGTLYLGDRAADEAVRASLAADGIKVLPYLQVYEDVGALPRGTALLADPATVNTALIGCLCEGVTLIEQKNPSTLEKAIKNETEIANIRLAHIRDGAAVTKLLYRVKKLRETEAFRKGAVTELSVSSVLHELRSEQPDFLGESFDSIIASGAHGAIVHYEPTEETDVPVVDDTFLLMDTGGQYLQGTTDITRTASIGTVTREMKQNYTAVLRGHLDLGNAIFRHGCTGAHLDVLARTPLWELGLDYNHGTGHGVGYLLNVHEGPNGIRLRHADGGIGAVLEAGMLTSDEPGVYLTGKYGIRIENLVLCKEAYRSETGTFMTFEHLTMVPYDRDSILPEMMTDRELDALNRYHKTVFDTISPYLTQEEALWLAEETRPIVR